MEITLEQFSRKKKYVFSRSLIFLAQKEDHFMHMTILFGKYVRKWVIIPSFLLFPLHVVN